MNAVGCETVEREGLGHKTLRLAIVSDAAPGRNGVGAYYQDLLEQLAPRVAASALLCPQVDARGRWRTGLALPLPGDRTQKLCLPNPLSLGRELKRLQPQVVIAATPGPYGLVGVNWAHRHNVPVLAGFHTSFEQLSELYWQGRWHGRVIQQAFERSHRYVFARSRSVLGNADPMLSMARRMGAVNTCLIATPIAAEFTATAPPSYDGAVRRVLFAGRLAAEKNLEAVLQAARAHPDLMFSIAGDGPLRESMQRAAEALPNLQLLGWQSRSALREQMDAHDVLLLPSHVESFGTIALEAMARARVVMVSSGCGIVEWPALRSGLVVIPPCGSAAEALVSLKTASPEWRRALARKAREEAQALNEGCLIHWLALLQGTVDQAADLPAVPQEIARPVLD
ncbi:glycosyltransferase [Marinimicrobium sp. ARAG 43.8]|uniref:glycosyltransferase n=1 Tax=Marinimicrobium sp. ARAG 43.8 TaxID=3418719 RepID=UPI003CE6D893